MSSCAILAKFWRECAILWLDALLLVFVALFGGVAQLGERRVRNAKVEGSIPFSSTNH